MLAYTKKMREVSVEPIQDVEPNKDGAYCLIYRYDDDGECEQDAYDDFCVHPSDCKDGKVFDCWGGLTPSAELYIREYVSQLDY